jgi:hypothetical protein
MRDPFELVLIGGPQRDTTRTLSRLVSQLWSYARSIKNKDEEEVSDEPVKITPRRLRLAFRRANTAGPERLAA